MKALAIIALVLGLGAVGAAGYAKVETFGNYQSLDKELKDHGPSTKYDVPLLQEYKDTLAHLHMIAWGAGALALVLGGVAMAKAKAKGGLPIAAIVLGVVGIGATVLSSPPWT